ncbi:hypothetical protein AB7W88_03320 [Providencia vermicola]|uniref:Uncharacterized protein n=1 Tax=Morganella morganii TaxID=582 RepID=A0AAI9HUZ2_MORMO|nr:MULTISPECIES: hypothetical protein [Providencia]EJV1663877.1 hypothetical protein [Klebsiella pneumoniae]EKW7426936.1 hypothetical protein [Proteus mirabilis]EKW8762913.1 hypothetical protein [Morganella morganii]ELI9034835.1 hypothetical protein [Morganella morganii]WOB88775.1 hypothetical protein P3L40_22925 [Providencia sp. PROV040]
MKFWLLTIVTLLVQFSWIGIFPESYREWAYIPWCVADFGIVAVYFFLPRSVDV